MNDFFAFMQHHSTLSIALIGVLFLLFIVEFFRAKLGTQRISPAQATQLINHQQAVILDIRSQDAFLNGHIVDAVSLPLADIEKQPKKLEKYLSRPIIIVCASGIESARAATLLLKQGYQVHILNGGVRAWKEAEMPLVKG